MDPLNRLRPWLTALTLAIAWAAPGQAATLESPAPNGGPRATSAQPANGRERNALLAMRRAREQAAQEKAERLEQARLSAEKRLNALREVLAQKKKRRARHIMERQERVRERQPVITEHQAYTFVSRKKSRVVRPPQRSFAPSHRPGVARGKKRGGAYFSRTIARASRAGRIRNARNGNGRVRRGR